MEKAQELHERAQILSKSYLRTEATLLSVLMEMKRLGVFAQLNYSGVFEYCERALKLSRSQSYYFKSVAAKSEEIPEMKTAITQGELTLSQARRIVPVITTENKAHWIAQAKALPQAELERAVSSVNEKAKVKERIKPVGNQLSELRVAVNPETEKDLEVLMNLLSQRKRRPATLAEVIQWASRVCRDKYDPERRAARVRKKPVSSGNTPLVAVAAVRRPIPASVKNEVVQKRGFRCSYVSPDGRRCEQRRWLDYHHLKEFRYGGLNRLDNLGLFCKQHHRWVHLIRLSSGRTQVEQVGH